MANTLRNRSVVLPLGSLKLFWSLDAIPYYRTGLMSDGLIKSRDNEQQIIRA